MQILGSSLAAHFRIKVAASSTRAMAIASAAPSPDIILLNDALRISDGLVLLNRLRTGDATRDIPVILLAGFGEDADVEAGFELGASDYIVKPVQPIILIARVRTQLELKVARDQLQRHSANLEHEVARRMRENDWIKDVSLHALATLAEARDRGTGAHILRTQSYIKALAHELQRSQRYAATLTDDVVHLIVKAAPLHDIGKVGMPDRILLKEGPLSPDEQAVMRAHTSIGAAAIHLAIGRVERDRRDEPTPSESLQFLEVACEMAQSHHERWDGSGYPEGLAAEQIPLPARLMAVADVFDALTSCRVYKPALGLRESVSLIEEGRGTQFDPDVVDAFMRVQHRLAEILLEHADESN